MYLQSRQNLHLPFSFFGTINTGLLKGLIDSLMTPHFNSFSTSSSICLCCSSECLYCLLYTTLSLFGTILCLIMFVLPKSVSLTENAPRYLNRICNNCFFSGSESYGSWGVTGNFQRILCHLPLAPCLSQVL